MLPISIGSEKEYGKLFTLVVQCKDSKGNYTGKTKEFSTDKAEELEFFWLRNNGIPPKKKKVVKASNEENKQDLNNVSVQKIQKKKQLRD